MMWIFNVKHLSDVISNMSDWCFSLQGSAAAVGETSYDGAGTESVQEEGDGLSVCLSVSVSVTDTELFVFCLSVVL